MRPCACVYLFFCVFPPAILVCLLFHWFWIHFLVFSSFSFFLSHNSFSFLFLCLFVCVYVWSFKLCCSNWLKSRWFARWFLLPRITIEMIMRGKKVTKKFRKKFFLLLFLLLCACVYTHFLGKPSLSYTITYERK